MGELRGCLLARNFGAALVRCSSQLDRRPLEEVLRKMMDGNPRELGDEGAVV
jgi:hypothetical protein